MALVTSSTSPRLSPGMLSIYGRPSIYGFGHDAATAFGVIYDMSSSNSGSYSVGQNVLIPYSSSNINYITYGTQTYWLVPESKIILVEVPDEPEELS